MKILLTGASGFLGSIIRKSLESDHEIISLGKSSGNQIQCDISNEIPTLPEVEMIIHAAGKAHVIPKTAEEKEEFFKVNEKGTANLLKGIKSLPTSLIFVSTVAVYGLEEGTQIDENAPLLGNTPYALSKIKAEELVKFWGEQHGVNVLIIRIPLIVGENPPGNLGAILKAIKSGYYFRLGDGEAKKSMVLAEDIANAIPGWLGHFGTYNLTDGNDPSLAEFDSYLAAQTGKKVKSLPLGPFRLVAKIGDRIPGFPLNTYRLEKLSQSLTFSDRKARQELGWNPRPVIGNFKS
ncbi:MAG: NAD-dependent epimerase/dehydratase family protein [Algoriphagus sp.]|nr:NAD-dependent epimerase/dehydratase family protein [Algoriphagus sp.]